MAPHAESWECDAAEALIILCNALGDCCAERPVVPVAERLQQVAVWLPILLKALRQGWDEAAAGGQA